MDNITWYFYGEINPNSEQNETYYPSGQLVISPYLEDIPVLEITNLNSIDGDKCIGKFPLGNNEFYIPDDNFEEIFNNKNTGIITNRKLINKSINRITCEMTPFNPTNSWFVDNVFDDFDWGCIRPEWYTKRFQKIYKNYSLSDLFMPHNFRIIGNPDITIVKVTKITHQKKYYDEYTYLSSRDKIDEIYNKYTKIIDSYSIIGNVIQHCYIDSYTGHII